MKSSLSPNPNVKKKKIEGCGMMAQLANPPP